MSRMTEALEKQQELEGLSSDEFQKKCSDKGYAPITKLGHKHELILDMMLDNPSVSTQEIAEKIGSTPTYVRKIRRTPLFIVEYEKVTHELHQRFRMKLMNEVGSATLDTMRALTDIITNEYEDTGQRLKAIKMLTDGDAFGLFAGKGKDDVKSSVNVNVNTGQQPSAASAFGVTADMLAESRERRLDKYKDGEVIDGEVQESTE